MFRSKSTFAILLASIFSGAQGFLETDRDVIGYAKVPKALGQKISNDQILDVEQSTGPLQVGPGFYMVNEPDWFEDDGRWFCVIEANTKKMKDVVKAWIPKEYETLAEHGTRGFSNKIQKIPLWGRKEDDILDYIGDELMIEVPEKALRFTWFEGLRQMTIPTEVVKNNELDFWADCFGTLEELRASSDHMVDWEGMWRIDTAQVWIWDGKADSGGDTLMTDASDGLEGSDESGEPDKSEEPISRDIADASSRIG